jgi:hypothetical protein
MNIIVGPYGKAGYCCRPDTSWEKENRDFYVPEGIDTVCWTPVVFARICKAGKCIGGKFISRYYDSFGFGALLYPQVKDCNDPAMSFAASSCIDHTSLLPHPLYDTDMLGKEDCQLRISANDEAAFQTWTSAQMKEMLEKAICEASGYISLRIGDYVAIELDESHVLAERQTGETAFRADFGEKEIFGIRIIF